MRLLFDGLKVIYDSQTTSDMKHTNNDGAVERERVSERSKNARDEIQL